MNIRKGQIEQIRIDKLIFGGRGIGTFEGIKVMVNSVVPGDFVNAIFRKIKKNYIEADLVEVITPSPDRQVAPCPYFLKCGGCQMQHVPYSKQLDIKKLHVSESLVKIGQIEDPPVADVIPCEENYHYRNKMEFSFGYDESMNFAFGFHMPKRRYDILDITTCHLHPVFFDKILNFVKDFMIDKSYLPYRYSDGEGVLKALFLREAKRTGEVMLNLHVAENRPDDFEETMKEFVDGLLALKDDNTKIVSIHYTYTVARRGEVKKNFRKLLHGKEFILEEMKMENGDSLSFEILPEAFFQVNTYQAEKLYYEIIKIAAEKKHDLIVDLFCGTGTIALFLAKYAKNVLGIELNLEAISSAETNANRNNIKNVEFIAGDVNKVLKTQKLSPSLLVVDPPRAGLAKKIIPVICEFNSPQIIYVSCNPATLARDISYFAEFGYKVKNVQPVDMFPNTYHIENVCLLER